MKRIVFGCSLFLLCAGLENFPKAHADDLTAMDKVCASYSPIKDAECLSNQLDEFDEQIEKMLLSLRANIKSEWGKLAEDEMRGRIDSSQKAWKLYRDDYCSFSYYSKASSHPPSEQEKIQRCKILKSKERIIEIKKLLPE